MINAKEAANMVQAMKKEEGKKRLKHLDKKVDRKIKKAAREGKYSISFIYLSDEEINALTSNGYDVTTANDIYIVSFYVVKDMASNFNNDHDTV